MKCFSEKALTGLNGYYVYALIDPRSDKIFYIGKGEGNRVFNHEVEADRNDEKEKLKTIKEIKENGKEVKKVLLHWGLSEKEAYAAETALINVFNLYPKTKLTNIVAGRYVHEGIVVEEFERIYGAPLLRAEDIRHNILLIKINKLYRRDMSAEELYETVRGVWRISIDRIKRRKVEYVFGVYNQLIVAVYKPTEWYKVYEKKNICRPFEFQGELDDNLKNRVYFVCDDYQKKDENQKFYLHKSISGLKVASSVQNPICYLYKNE